MAALQDGRCVNVNVVREFLEWRRKRAVPFLLWTCAMCEFNVTRIEKEDEL